MGRNSLQNKPKIRFRVQDENGKIASHAELGAAIGWAKQRVSALHRRLLRSDPGRNQLPHRQYKFAWPEKKIKRIEIESVPWRGVWEVRIIGGESFGGSLLWMPFDDTRGFSFGNKRSEFQLVKAEGKDGPYTVSFQPDLRAQRIDWKGPLRTEDANGDPLPVPVRDVLTWEGPQNRYGPQHVRATTLGEFVWKDGRKYARSPRYGFRNQQPFFGWTRDFDGLDDPENDPENRGNAQFLFGAVVGAAIQEKDGERRDVLITQVVNINGGAQGVGDVTWHVWWRPAGVGLGTNGIFQPSINGDDPNKWHLIASLPAHSIVSQERQRRHSAWFFNESGTEASTMIPDNTVGDYLPNPSVIPILTRRGNIDVTDPAKNTQGVQPPQFPYYLSMGTISVDAFAETASISIGARSAGPARGINNPFQGTCSASGSSSTTCPEPGVPQTSNGSFSENASGSASSSVNGGPWTVAVDYKGDTKVTAQIHLKSSGSATNFSYSQTSSISGPSGSGTTTGSYDQTIVETSGYELRAGGLNITLSDFNRTRSFTAETASFNYTQDGPGSDSRIPAMNAFEGNLMWLDLRTDLALWAFVASGSVVASGSNGVWRSSLGGQSFGGQSLNSRFHRITYDVTSSTEVKIAIQLIQGSSVLAEHSLVATDDSPPFIGGGFDGVQFGITRTFPGDPELGEQLCPVGESFTTEVDSGSAIWDGKNEDAEPSEIIARGPPSLESLARRDDQEARAAGGFQVGTVRDVIRFYSIATDGAGNVAMSVETWNGANRQSITLAGGRGASITPPPISATDPKYLNFLSGDDLIEVMNSIPHFDRGADNTFGTPDDVPIEGIDEITGRIASGEFNGLVFVLG